MNQCQAMARNTLRAIAAFFVLLAAPAWGQSASPLVRAGSTFAQPGDQLHIKVWPQQAFGPPVTVSVDPRGSIVLPQVGLVTVTSIPIFELRDTLKLKFKKFIQEPEVDVTVLRRVTVNGAVMRPDVYYMDVSSTLRDAIARAGGVSEVGSRSKVSIIRHGVSRQVKDWETDTSESSTLQSGDQVIVGRRSWVAINIIPLVSLGLATASFLISTLRKP